LGIEAVCQDERRMKGESNGGSFARATRKTVEDDDDEDD
jgi:hypothetical protein